jgi:agmatine deiminase
MNFVISNGVVLVARYWRAGRSAGTLRKDRMAKRILQTVFPGRQIVQIDAETLNFGGGGMHCATQQEPAVP